LQDSEKAKKMGEASRKRALSIFDVDRVNRQMLKIMEI